MLSKIENQCSNFGGGMRRAAGFIGIVFTALLIFLLTALPVDACTTFIIDDDEHLVFGRNLDWFVENGMITVNQRGIVKAALIFPPDTPAVWVSKYGSVTFNQVGKELPYGGINEAGLIVENLTMLATEYPPADERPAANEVQWIQYQLDNFETVEQVIAGNEKIRIGQNSTQLHYMVCDRFGHAAAIEFLHGKMKAYTGDKMPVRVLTNSTYEQSLDYLGEPDSSEYDFSLVRFKTASEKVRQYYKKRPKAIIDYSFGILESVCFDPQSKFSTKWSIVYDIKNMKIYFKTLTHPAIKTIEINKLDFTCGRPSPVLDMAIEEAGDVTDNFIDYTTAMNRDLIMGTFGIFKAQGFLDIADSLLLMLSEYPAGMPCQDTLDR